MGRKDNNCGTGRMNSKATILRTLTAATINSSRFRRICLILGVASVTAMQGCSVLPGMFILPGKAPTVMESPTEPATVSYELIKVTPMLVRDLNNKASARLLNKNSPIDFGKSDSFPYRLGPQDALRIFVWGNPDLTPINTTLSSTNVASTPAGRTIDENGNIFFPMVGTIRASGLTVSQFRESLSRRLSKFIKDPQVEVDVAGFRSQKVFISGQIRNPGIIPITDQPMTLVDAIGLAGGATDNSDLYSVVLTRGKVSATINVDKLYFNGDLSSNIYMTNGDIISIPDRMMRKVFVLGEVGNSIGSNQARSYVMRRGSMTLTEVLADAGGASPFSSASNEIYVMRLDENGKPLVYMLDAVDPTALMLAEQFPIQPRDLVFVNPTGPTMIGRFIGQFLPLIQTVNTAATTPF